MKETDNNKDMEITKHDIFVKKTSKLLAFELDFLCKIERVLNQSNPLE